MLVGLQDGWAGSGKRGDHGSADCSQGCSIRYPQFCALRLRQEHAAGRSHLSRICHQAGVTTPASPTGHAGKSFTSHEEKPSVETS
jgi:hypothetical protein